MHSYTTLAVLVLAASAVSPAVSAPVHDSVKQDARDLNLSNVLESRAHGIIGDSEQLRRELETRLAIPKLNWGKLFNLLGWGATGLSIAQSFGQRSAATHITREEVDLVLRQMGKRSISPADLFTSLLSQRDSLVDALAELKYYERDSSESLSKASEAFSRTLDELD